LLDGGDQGGRRHPTPVEVIEGRAQMHVEVQVGIFHLRPDVLQGLQQTNPAKIFFDLFSPFLIIAVIGAVKIQDVAAEQDEFAYAGIEQRFDDVALEGLNVVGYGIIPFADQFQNGVPICIIGVKNLKIKGIGSEIVPLGMDVVIVNPVMESKFGILTTIEGTLRVFRSGIKVQPVIIWFNVVHSVPNSKRAN